MILYTYRCTACGREFSSSLRADCLNSECCSSKGQRVWGFGMASIMHEHMNQSLGRPVSSMRQFKDGLKQKSEEATARTGVEHNFQPVDITDRKSLGVTDEGIERG